MEAEKYREKVLEMEGVVENAPYNLTNRSNLYNPLVGSSGPCQSSSQSQSNSGSQSKSGSRPGIYQPIGNSGHSASNSNPNRRRRKEISDLTEEPWR
ncbi:MAG: hypothetical protein ABEI74_02035 [Candidatus Pacearchaeota archaeon]